MLYEQMTIEERHALGIYDLDLDYPDFDQSQFSTDDLPL